MFGVSGACHHGVPITSNVVEISVTSSGLLRGGRPQMLVPSPEGRIWVLSLPAAHLLLLLASFLPRNLLLDIIISPPCIRLPARRPLRFCLLKHTGPLRHSTIRVCTAFYIIIVFLHSHRVLRGRPQILEPPPEGGLGVLSLSGHLLSRFFFFFFFSPFFLAKVVAQSAGSSVA